MNKKKLSVVMAGAMLCSSVAPVLAATVEKEEVSASNLGLFISEIRELLKSKTYSDTSKDAIDVNNSVAGDSVYKVVIKGVDLGLDTDSTQQQFQNALGNLKPGTVVEIWEKGYDEVDGKVLSQKKSVPTYEASDLTTLKTTFDNLKTGNLTQVIKTVNAVSGNKLVIELESGVPAGASLEIKVGDEKLDTDNYLTPTNVKKSIATAEVAAADFAGFPKADPNYGPIADGEKIKEYTITSGGNNLTVEDLYDGLMLTTVGHDFFEELKEAEIARGTDTRTVTGNNGTDITNKTDVVNAIVKDANGKYSFTVEIPAGNDLAAAKYTITGSDEKNTERLATWIKAKLAKVDILAGSNRYATAVEIAETYTGLTEGVVTDGNALANGTVANIVLVNGEALVDGLAAAPLAADLGSDANHRAPILLTAADKLPKETKAYLRRALAQVTIGNVKKVTIHLVGGEAVLSNSLVRELRDMGFSVERYGGANREETSLEVAKAINNTTNKRVFVVGADGEADAMSISAVAATKITGSNEVSPIIVAKRGGLSEDAMYELRDMDAVVIGGEKSVSKEEVDALRDEAESVIRVAGANRQATNAEIVTKYYSGKFADLANAKAENVVVAKDGQHNKMDLVDALAASNFAAHNKAPIVLATNKLSDAQINALELNAEDAEALYQVGHGVDKDNVVKVIAGI